MTADQLADILWAGLTAGLFVALPRWYRRHQEQRLMAGLMLLALVWRVYGAMDPLLHCWDERYHALVARHLMDAPLAPRLYQAPVLPYDYRNWTANEVWLHKQPFALWMMAGSLSLLGIGTFVLRVPSLLASVGSVWLTYRIGKRIFPARAAWLAAGYHAVNGLVLETAAGRVTTDHIDTIFLFLVEAAVYLSVRSPAGKRPRRADLFLAGIAMGLAILTKWLAALVVVPVWLVWRGWAAGSRAAVVRDALLLGGVAVLVALPWQWYAWRQFPLEYIWETAYNLRHISEGLERHGKPWWYYLDKIRITVNEGIYLAMAWLGIRLVRGRDRSLELVTVWIALPLVVFSMAETKMPGYQLIAFPAYFLLLGRFTEAMASVGNAQVYGVRRWAYFLVAAVLPVLGIRYGLERLKPFQAREAPRKVAGILKKMEIPPNSLLFNVPCPIELMFYHDCTAYEGLPPVERIRGWSAAGKRVIVLDGVEVPPDLRQMEGVSIIRQPELQAHYRGTAADEGE